MREGELLAGKYLVERVLGQGGMGVVVAARHIVLEERVAVKFLLPEVLSHAEMVARFVREARAAVRIKSEHVARVTDVGQLENGAPYMVMEYLDGRDLAALLQERGPLPVEEAVDYVVQVCEAIAAAHALGIIHRDLKPSNLMRVIGSDGSPCIKVLDFGISKVASQGSLAMTKTSAVFGSPLYMSPEQMMSSRDVDDRSDIWSLGVILYELLAGVPPFFAETQAGLGMLIASQPAGPVRAHRPEVAPGLEAVVSRCLQKRREERFGNVAELAAALAPFAPRRSIESIERAARILRAQIPPVSGPQPQPEPEPAVARSGSRSGSQTATAVGAWGATDPKPSRKGRWIAVGGGAVLVLGAAGAVVVTLRRPTADPIAPSFRGPASSSVAAAPPPPPAAQSLPPTPEPRPAASLAPEEDETHLAPLPASRPANGKPSDAPPAHASSSHAQGGGHAATTPKSADAGAPSPHPAQQPSALPPRSNYEDM